jgi:hypothetical protein
MFLGFTTMDCVPDIKGLAKIAAILSRHCSMPILDISIMWPTGQSYSVTLTSVLSPPQLFEGD